MAPDALRQGLAPAAPACILMRHRWLWALFVALVAAMIYSVVTAAPAPSEGEWLPEFPVERAERARLIGVEVRQIGLELQRLEAERMALQRERACVERSATRVAMRLCSRP